MSFDFFNEGIKDQPKFKPTHEEQAFFQSKLPFLDPSGQKTILLSQAINLLQFSNLDQTIRQKILMNVKVIGKPSITYLDMKKILRAVALAQNKIEPSVINIQANAKTMLAIFYDDDDEEDQEEEEQPQVPQKKVESKPALETTQPSKLQQKPRLTAVPPNPHSRPPLKNTQTVQNPTPHSPTTNTHQKPVEDSLTLSIKRFDEYWVGLPTEEGQKISGSEVKKLFGKSENRKELSKIWKICNITHKGVLTKGQLFVFVQLMKLKSGSIPSSLSQQMIDIIHKIDKANGHKKTSEAFIGNSQLGISQFDMDKSQGMQKSQHIQKKETKKQLRTSLAQGFQNFEEFGKPTSPTTKVTENRPLKRQVPIPQVPKDIHNFPQQSLNQIHSTSLNQMQILVNNIIPQLKSLSDQNLQANQVLAQVNQYMNSIEQTQTMVGSKITEIKTAQDDLNHRLNMTCIRMRDVIQKQFELIKDLKETMDGQVELNVERVGVLEGYVENAEEQMDKERLKNNPGLMALTEGLKNAYNQVHNENDNAASSAQNSQQPSKIYNKKLLGSMKEMSMSMSVAQKNKKEDSSRNMQNDQKKQQYESNESANDVPASGGIYRQKLFEQLRQQKRQFNSDENEEEESNNYEDNTPRAQPERRHDIAIKQTEERDVEEEDEKDSSEEEEAPNHVEKIELKENGEIPLEKIEPTSQQIPQQNQEEEAAKRIYMKRVYAIQMVNYLAPIKQEQYAIIIGRVQAMNEAQLDALYANLYKKYEQMQNNGGNQAAQLTQNKDLPTADEFSTNNFKNAAKNNNSQADFFGI